MNELTQSYLKSILNYNPDTGIFTWKVSNSPRVKIGSVAGGLNNHGYIVIVINKKHYLAHRLVCLYMYGKLPPERMDHINHVRDDNRIINLRLASSQENNRNASRRKDNKSGCVGVSWHPKANKWQAYINVNNNEIYLGVFLDIDDAIKARKQAEIKYGFHENHGKKYLK